MATWMELRRVLYRSHRGEVVGGGVGAGNDHLDPQVQWVPAGAEVHQVRGGEGQAHQALAERLDRRDGQLVGQLGRSEEHTSELQSRGQLVYRLLLEKKKKLSNRNHH